MKVPSASAFGLVAVVGVELCNVARLVVAVQPLQTISSPVVVNQILQVVASYKYKEACLETYDVSIVGHLWHYWALSF